MVLCYIVIWYYCLWRIRVVRIRALNKCKNFISRLLLQQGSRNCRAFFVPWIDQPISSWSATSFSLFPPPALPLCSHFFQPQLTIGMYTTIPATLCCKRTRSTSLVECPTQSAIFSFRTLRTNRKEQSRARSFRVSWVVRVGAVDGKLAWAPVPGSCLCDHRTREIITREKSSRGRNHHITPEKSSRHTTEIIRREKSSHRRNHARMIIKMIWQSDINSHKTSTDIAFW